jgi:hypothetical protein
VCIQVWDILYVVQPYVLYLTETEGLSAKAVCPTGYGKASNDAIQQSGTNYPSQKLISILFYFSAIRYGSDISWLCVTECAGSCLALFTVHVPAGPSKNTFSC